jgi:asparagine synthase (glutamine-hydrolysing)
MWNRARTLLTTSSGGITNFRELAAELAGTGYAFATRSDAEILLAFCEHWGVDAIDRLRGAFAFALWSEEAGECVLARDPLGIKPLYYAVIDGTLYFASEAVALLAAPDCPRDLDLAALGDYLAYGYVPGERSIWRSIRKLPPAHLLVWSQGEARTRRYWTPPVEPESQASVDPAALRAELEEAIRLAMISDVPVGAFLSGGLDSSAVVALMSATGEPVDSYTFDFNHHPDPDRTEAAYAREVARRCGTRHHERHVVLDRSIDALARVVGSYDEPIADASITPTFFLAEEVASDMKVAISGEGGGVIFGGHRRLGKIGWFERIGLFGDPGPEQIFRRVGFFDAPSREALLDPALAGEMDGDPLWFFRAHWRPELSLSRRLQILHLNTTLPDQTLARVDRASMCHALETRLPLLDHRLVEHVLRLPVKATAGEKEGAQLLRAAAGGRLPERIQSLEPKEPFSPLALEPVARLRAGELVRRGLVRREAIENLAARPSGRNASRAWLLLILDLWIESHCS